MYRFNLIAMCPWLLPLRCLQHGPIGQN